MKVMDAVCWIRVLDKSNVKRNEMQRNVMDAV